jgi:integrase
LEDWHYFDSDRYGQLAKTMPVVNYWGRRITTIKRAWKSAVTGAKITRRLRPYDLRHRFVTLALESGVDIGILSDIVGSRPETLRKYYQHVTAAMHHNAVSQIKGLDIKIITKKDG